ncbi:hypothetical protein DACRYDRAFT_117408 [Dacryopinax primogenitus]|uniref:Uncharacterized protein n=1 Tax=Dacryopinax primogenitus (strain DJM 731) TaxID=1858805 RepID=M5G9H5_DACPD|nr:uncharacterized protein DACRYDRAFT_117408 [Dacryopinax primogenitus]EJU00453.1 hypothetical protein DACRYDRAFT_117408 [Dacryopinax primogenitus]
MHVGWGLFSAILFSTSVLAHPVPTFSDLTVDEPDFLQHRAGNQGDAVGGLQAYGREPPPNPATAGTYYSRRFNTAMARPLPAGNQGDAVGGSQAYGREPPPNPATAGTYYSRRFNTAMARPVSTREDKDEHTLGHNGNHTIHRNTSHPSPVPAPTPIAPPPVRTPIAAPLPLPTPIATPAPVPTPIATVPKPPLARPP